MAIINRRSPYRNWRMDQSPGRSFTINRASPQYNGLVSLWTCFGQNRGVVALRDEIGHFNMAAFNTPTISSSLFGPVVLFDDGANEYLRVNNSPIVTYPLTISVWFNSDDVTINQFIVDIHDIGTNTYVTLEAAGTVAGDPVRFYHREQGAGGAAITSTTSGFSANTWHLATGVKSAANAIAVFIDGKNKGTDATNKAVANLDQVNIGVGDEGGGLTKYFSGNVSEVRIYNRNLSDGEVWALYAPSTRWDLYRSARRAFFMFVPAAPVVGQPMMLRSTIVPHTRQWQPRGLRG